MSIRKKEIKRIIFVFIFASLILLSNFQTFNNLIPIIDNGENNSPFNKENDEFPLSSNSNLNLTDYITGNGNNQTVRFYAENLSYSLDNQEYFNITAPAHDTYLSSGDFNFTFQKNYTTEHVLEDDDALYPDSGSFIEKYQFNINETYSSITINPGMNLTEGGLNNLTDTGGDTTFWILNSSTNGRLNFTICANFSKISDFNRSDIAGLLLFLSYNLSLDANLTIKMKDFNTNFWKNVTNTVFINSSNPITQEIDERIINENLNFIDESNCSLIQIIFNRTDLLEFNVTLFEFDLYSVVLFEIPITNTSYVALEFDLRGYNTTVNGFHAWIRTLNLSEAVNAILNITLYKSNDTIDRTASNLQTINLGPDYASKIDSILVKYSNDNLSYFKFNLSNTDNLILYNYFIVIKSNSSKNIFSLVTIPCDGTYGDSKTEHQLKITTDCGKNWTNAKKSVGGPEAYQLDASSFKLNVTRGYMPSDFLVNSMITLKVDNVSLVNQKIEAYPYNDSTTVVWEWGKGRWNNDFSVAIKDGIDDKFRVNLTWNENITKGFMFNVSYRAKSYNIENATCMYNITYNGIPNWILNYSLDLNKFPNWNFTEFWYIYPTYLDPHNLTTPAPYNEQVFSQTGGKEIFSENPNYNKTVITTAIIYILQPDKYNGSYLLNLTSFNCMLDVHSYINFKGNLWETNSFMYGDNISVSTDIQDHDGLAPPNNGHANVTLYYTNYTRYFTKELYSTEGKKSGDNSMLSYDFNNHTILNLTSNKIRDFGEYYLGYFWTNGTAIGAKKMVIYIDTYEIDVMDCVYYPNNNYNVLQGTIDKIDKGLNTYSLLTASINETTGIYTPDFYPISNLSVNKLFSYNYFGEEFQVSLKTFKQNETVLNPNETINFKISIQNFHEISDVNVKLKIKLVSLANNEWIIAENTSIPVKLRFNGHENDTHDFNINLTMPTLDPITKIWKGINAPVRFAGAKAIVTVYIENNTAGTYESRDYSVLINKTENLFEGYIIALKIDNEISSATLTKTFERNECIYLPNNSSFILNIYDRYFLSSYDSFIKEIPLKLDSEFINISINPEAPIYGKTLELTSILTNEFGDTLSYQSVTCQYYNKDNSWIDLDSSKLTDANGSITFEIDTMNLEIDENLLLRLTWSGNNTVLSNYENVPINLIMQSNDFSIIFDTCDNPVIYRNSNSSLVIYITNTGNSTLKIYNIIFDIDDNLKYTIKEINYLELNHLEPGETTCIIIEIEVLNVDFNLLNITVSITGKNIISPQKIKKEITVSLNVLDYPFIDFLLGFLIIFVLSLIALFWVSTYFYAKKVIKKIETPIEEVVEKRPRKGKYVKISDLKTEEKEKAIDSREKIEKPPREKKADKKKITDLDSLLKEKKLDADKIPVKKDKPKEVKKKEIIPKKIDKKKDKGLEVDKKLVKKDKPTEVKSKKVSPKKETIDLKNLNKFSVKKLKEFCKENNIKIQSQAKKSEIIKILKKSLSEEKKEGKITDFDSLLKEKGLNDKK